ncbi:MAG: hypothetical protein HUK05_08295, partial [Prevotella sp.]|nr:hypothetical protein [Prevotella sp.]
MNELIAIILGVAVIAIGICLYVLHEEIKEVDANRFTDSVHFMQEINELKKKNAP